MKTISLILRKLKKSSTATVLGILGLIAGLVCVLYIFFWINDEISFNRFHKNFDRIFVVHAYLETGGKPVTFNGCPPAVGPAMKAEYPEVENTCRYVPGNYFKMLISDGIKKEEGETAFTDFSLFDIFTIPFVYGNIGDSANTNRIVLSQHLANAIFGPENPVGKVVKFNNQLDLTVVGVVKDMPINSTIRFDAAVPLQNLRIFYGRDEFLNTWYNNGFKTFGLLTSTAGYDKIASTITRRIQKEMPESTNFLKTYLYKYEYLYEQNHIRNVRIFGLIGIMVLLAAALNFINLITARMTKQAKEAGVRKSLGATRANIIKLIYSDVAFTCLMAFIAALIITLAGLPFFGNLIGKPISFHSIFTPVPILGIVILYLITVLLTGGYPAVFLSGISTSSSLKSSYFSVKNNGVFRNALVL
jgi:putative ABC transport system permease protein